MLRYETLMLTNSHITKDEINMLESFFDKLAANFSGKMFAFDNWDKQRLAYTVKKNDYGTYVLVRYELPLESLTAFFKELDSFFKIKCNEIVLRNVTVKLDPKKTLEYRKPESVTSRSGNLDSFIRENKMDKFLDSDERD
ncbi:30S ribosomal protein S6 [Candidatus Dependentiae bacterium]|nr:30S ribosomal protein S6 [Candidatus Dependentiae bacterium]MBU4387348.1 30S ribosomal protein S6 [Candidatus Dependentiae bacterium]MCG2756187.1 30S ribosomal protein S6 [Candidatus Dependentiae bacterium]